MSPGIKQVVVWGDAEGTRPPGASANDALVPLVTILANPGDVEGALRDLALRIEGLLAGEPPANRGKSGRNPITVGEVAIDHDAHRVTVGGEEISLTGLEFRLLVALVDRRDRVYPRGALLSDVWGSSALNRTRTVDTHVKRLRDKLKSAGKYVQTVRSIGYRFSETPSIRSVDIGARADGRRAAPCMPMLRRA